jgi:hypothetical protein
MIMEMFNENRLKHQQLQVMIKELADDRINIYGREVQKTLLKRSNRYE